MIPAMYIPDAFREENPAVLHEIMRRYSFATLISGSAASLQASHLPFLFDAERNVLRCHMARANRQWNGFQDGGEVMVLFQGPHAYISPTWYETQLAVPTWNYVTVHAYGQARVVDETALRAIVDDTVRLHEADRENPWPMPLPEEYLAKLLRGIVGFEISITRLEGKLKLSQNRSAADVRGVIDGLIAGEFGGEHEVAEWMKRVSV